MNNLLPFLLSLLFTSFCYAQNLYVKGDTNPYSCDQFETLLNDTLSNTNTDIMFFVHGRGRHPEKGLNYMPTFEGNFNLKIVMFDWKSWINEISRPEDNAKDASESLGQCLKKLQDFKLKNIVSFKNRNLFFMIHSMGNIVLENYMEKFYRSNSLLPNLFNAMILNAPDIETDGHSKWLNRVDYAENKYLIYNHDDAVLIGSKAIDYKDLRFGRGTRLGAYIGSDLSMSTTYLDISKISLGGHEHFLEDKKHKITQIFNSIFHHKAKFNIDYKRDKKFLNLLHFK